MDARGRVTTGHGAIADFDWTSMRELETEFALAECMDVTPERCIICGRCGLQRLFKEALNAWFQVLDRYTLADALGIFGIRRLGFDSRLSTASIVGSTSFGDGLSDWN